MKLVKILSLALCLGSIALPVSAQDMMPTLSDRKMVKVAPDARYKVVYDVHTTAMGAGINRGLYYARGLIEAFGKQGVKPAQLDIHLVLHGDAAHFLLVDERYRDVVADPFAVNLNTKITQDLLNLGVSVEICHSTMRSNGWTADDVLPGVTIVHDGYTRIIKLQNDGYAYIGGF